MRDWSHIRDKQNGESFATRSHEEFGRERVGVAGVDGDGDEGDDGGGGADEGGNGKEGRGDNEGSVDDRGGGGGGGGGSGGGADVNVNVVDVKDDEGIRVLVVAKGVRKRDGDYGRSRRAARVGN